MAKKKKAKKKALKQRGDSLNGVHEHVLDRLYLVIDSRKGADPDTSYTARLFSRGRAQIAKKLGEEASRATDPSWSARAPTCSITCSPCGRPAA
jgi:phosphoribosyl-ATP pyrophosphohydrolase